MQKHRETNCLRHELIVNSNQDYIERGAAVVWMWVEDIETAIKQAQEDMRNSDNAELTTGAPQNTNQEMIVAIGDCLSNLSSSDNKNDQEDQEEIHTELGKLSDVDTPSWVISTIFKTVQQCMERCWQMPMILHELIHLGCGDTADYIHEWDKKYRTAKLRVWALVNQLIDDVSPTPARTRFGELM